LNFDAHQLASISIYFKIILQVSRGPKCFFPPKKISLGPGYITQTSSITINEVTESSFQIFICVILYPVV